MKGNTTKLRENVEKLFDSGKFDDLTALLTDEVLKTKKDVELYTFRGFTWYIKKEYDKAVTDYNDALEINSDYELAFYNRGSAWVAKKEYDKAIDDYNKVIKLKPYYLDYAYTARGNVWKARKKFDKAIDDYTQAIRINPHFANAYYGRGLAQKGKLAKRNNIDLNEIKYDFDKYLGLTADKNDIGAKYAKYYIEELSAKINNPELWFIEQLVNAIKNKLQIRGRCIIHYTGLSGLESLILDNNKFRISEGNFMNDPTEGKEFFDFLEYKPYVSHTSRSGGKTFSQKPFIGSFVTKEMHNNLNMWRFYGKEKGVEAKGCAITLNKHKFIDDIKNSLSNEETREARLDDESDINFYRVVYVSRNGGIKFNIQDLDTSEELERLMNKLKERLNSYKGDNTSFLEKYLNSIAFLFKSDAYKNENEVRLVVKGIEFEKKYNMDVSSPRVYIELVSIKDIVSQITLGPKVDKVSEWITAFHYCYEKKTPTIMISRLPYK